MNFAFMSFSCPELDIRSMVATAKKYGYAGIEPRLDADHKHGIEVNATNSALKEAAAIAAEQDIKICCLATSCRFADPENYLEHQEHAGRVIELAAKIGVPAIRVFGGAIPDGVERSRSFDQIVRALGSLSDKAQEHGVALCMETHDSWCDPEQVARVIKTVNHPAVAVNWDIMHPVLTAQVAMDTAFETLKPYIRHVHVHDGVRHDGKLTLVPIGEGQVDHKSAVVLLRDCGYQGYISGEWINWEPYEVHLPREIARLKRYV
ncbi:MAG: sugar phosphate isomerase/epimerase [Ruminococcaceae bacterium]|nr:sugar phosphate isomerase/epimerase [Oscillospiraceae bacterium]